MTDFSDLGLIEPLLRAVAAEGYATATPIQAQAIPALLAGRDVLGLAQTGTGKTAAFALPILQHLYENRKRLAARTMRALVLTPTRELALQIRDGFTTYGGHLPIRCTVVHGGVSQMPQVHALARGTDVLVATPGRLLDLMAQKHAVLDSVEVFVLDEADRMLDMGFIDDVRTIAAALPARRQTLLFSATMPDAVARLAASVLARDHLRIAAAPPATPVEQVEQRVLFVERADKPHLLTALLRDAAITRAIVFTRTRDDADRMADHLKQAGVAADSLHGEKSQAVRFQALEAFRAGTLRALVATDVAARGLDVDGVTHVINVDLPGEPESYVHRIGRTARAGSAGTALSFCDAEEVRHLKAIERTIRRPIPADPGHPYHAAPVARLYDTAKAGGADKSRARHDRRPPRHGGAPKKAPR